MSQLKRTTVKINGDSNAVGDGNNITIIKEIHNHNYRQSSEESHSPAAPAGLILIVVFSIALAMAALAFWFGRNATIIYAVEFSLPFAYTITATLLMIYGVYNDDPNNAKHAGAIAVIAAILTAAVKLALTSYSADWIDLANSVQSYKQFWCSLSYVDQQSALQHAIQALVLLAPAVILVTLHITSVFFRCIEFPEWRGNVLKKMTGTTSLMITAALCVLSLVAHTEFSFNMWQDKFNSHSSLICPNKQSESP